MNAQYKTIWNEATQSWVAVSEISRAKGKKSSSLKSIAAALLLIGAGSSAQAAVSAGPNGEFCQQATAGGTWTCHVPNGAGGIATISNLPDIGGAQPDYVALKAAVAAKLGTGAILIGNINTVANGNNAIALGNGATATQNSVTLGTGAGAGIAPAAQPNSSNDLRVNIGYGAGSGASSTTDLQRSVNIGTFTGSNRTGTIAGAGVFIGSDGDGSVAGFGNGTGSLGSGSDNIGIGTETAIRVVGDVNVAMGGEVGNNVLGSKNIVIAGLNAGTNVTGNDNLAFGSGSGNNITANRTISMGTNANASKLDAIALGSNTKAFGERDVIIGANTVGPADGSSISAAVAVGSNITFNATGAVGRLESTAVGANSNVADYGVAVGALATAGLNGTAIGTYSQATGNGAIAIGAANNTTGTGSAIASAAGATAVGSGSQATVAGGVALGQGSIANTAAGITGYAPSGATATQIAAINATKATLAAVSVGSAGNTRQITNVAAGTVDTDAVNVAQLKAGVAAATTHYYSVNDGGTVGGNYNNDGATGQNSLAAGVGAKATDIGGVAIGLNAQTGGGVSVGGGNVTTSGVAVGRSNVTSTDGYAFGSGNKVSSASSNAIGYNNNVGFGFFNHAFGNNNQIASGGQLNVALGGNNTLSKAGGTAVNLTVAVGGLNKVEADRSSAIGVGNTVSSGNSVAVGGSNVINSSATGSFVLGNNVTVNNANNVVLGNASSDKAFVQVNSATVPGRTATLNPDGTVTYTAGPAVTYSGFAGTATGVVSVGAIGAERQIVNVAAGQISATSTDAINGSQLYAVASNIAGQVTNVVNNSKTHYYSVNDNGVVGGNYNNDGATGVNALAAGVAASAAGESATSVGVSASALGIGSVAIGNGARANDNVAVAINGNATGTQATAINGSANGTGSVAIGGVSSGSSFADGEGAVAIGWAANASADNATALGYSSRASAQGATALGGGQASAQDAIAIGTNAQTTIANNVSLGANSVDKAAVEVDSATVEGRTATLNPDGTVTYTAGPTIVYSGFAGTATGVVSVGALGAERQIVNVAAGEISATSTDAINGSQLYAVAAAINGSVTNIVNNAQTHYYSVNDGGTQQANYANDGATGANSVASGVAASSAGASSVAMGHGANVAVAATGGVAIGKDASTTVAGGVAIGEGSVSSTAGGVAGYVPPTADAAQTAAIAATTSTTGALAVGNAANGTYRQITGLAAGSADSDAVNVAQLKAVQTAVVESKTHYYSVNDGGVAQGNYNNDGATGLNSMASGVNASAAGAGATAVGAGATANLANNVALGSGSVDRAAVQVNSATITNAQGDTHTYGGFAGTAAGVVSVGSKGSERQIVNVAPGEISATSTDAVNGSQLYSVATQIGISNTTINNRINNVENKLSGGVASAIALGAIPYADPGRSVVGVSVAGFNGETGVGVNVLKRSYGGRYSVHAGLGYGTGGAKASWRVGAAMQFGSD